MSKRQGIKSITKANMETRRKAKKKEEDKEDTPQWGVNELLEKAEELLENYQPELAQKFYEKGLLMDPNHTPLMDSFAQMLLDMDDFERAKELLVKSVQLAPNANWMKYMNLGQLLQGSEAIQCFNKGIELMMQHRQSLQSGQIPAQEGEIQLLNQEISSALCSQAELFMTDACFEENAEVECEKYLMKALEFDANNAETLQTFANFRMCQQRTDEALKLLTQSYALWKDCDDLNMPSVEFCHTCAKMFLELEQDRTAAEIWEQLLEVDDNIAEIHYHLGLAYRFISTEASKECLARAKELLGQCDDPQLLQLVDDLIRTVETENYVEPEDEEDKGDNSSEDEMDVK